MDNANLLPAMELGTVVAGKYRIDRTLAEGGMGVVVAATHIQLDQVVALKFLRADVGSEFDARARFTREARAAAQLRSEHVARVLDAGVTDDGTPYIAMEYLEGQSLARALQTDGPMDVTRAVECIIQVCEGLAEAHARGIVHRDIKPYNLFLVERSPGWSAVKILDFGISKFAFPDASNVATGVILGSPCYMSPEQLRSTATVDHRTDIWSVGATLYELLAGHAAFDASQTLHAIIAAILDQNAPDLQAAREDVPAELTAIINRCLSKDRENRFASAGELAMALLPFSTPRSRVNAELAASMRPAFPPNEGPAPSNPPAAAPTLRALPSLSRTPVPSAPPSRPSLIPSIPSAPPSIPSIAPSNDMARTTEESTGTSRKIVAPVALTIVAEDPSESKPLGTRSAVPWLRRKTVGFALGAAFIVVAVALGGRGRGGDNSATSPANGTAHEAMVPTIAAAPPALPALASGPVGAPPPASLGRIELVVRASPTTARITIDDRPVENPFVASYPRDGSAHRIAARAWGYDPKIEEVSFDSDLILDLGLFRHPAPNGPPPSPPPAVPEKHVATAPEKHSAAEGSSVRPIAASPAQEIDSTGGRPPLHAIDTKDPYSVP